jgi:hypothetical protein
MDFSQEKVLKRANSGEEIENYQCFKVHTNNFFDFIASSSDSLVEGTVDTVLKFRDTLLKHIDSNNLVNDLTLQFRIRA